MHGYKRLSKTRNNKFKPLVSIVIPVYNGANFIEDALRSALRQSYRNLEIIVVDDGSTDNTAHIISKYTDKIRYFKKSNGGVSSALNYGIRKAKGSLVSWLSHDDLYYPKKIAHQVSVIQKLDNKARNNTILFSRYDILIDNTISSISNDKLIFVYSKDDPEYTFSMLDALFSSKLNGCTMLFSKNLFYKYGFFDETIKTVQDYTLFTNFLKNGVMFLYDDNVLVTSRHHSLQDTIRFSELHKKEVANYFKYVFATFKNTFQEMPLWKYNHFLEIIKRRGFDYTYPHLLTEWANTYSVKNKPIIWTYWENQQGINTPDYIRLCWKSIVLQNKNILQIKIITPDDIDEYLPNLKQHYKKFNYIAHKADYIRFNLLYKYGGIWVDSDFVAFKSISGTLGKVNRYGFVCMGYKINMQLFPLIGFLGARKGNSICLEMIKSINVHIDKLVTYKIQPKWDEIGGELLRDKLRRKQGHYFIYDSEYFCPYPIQFKPVDNLTLFSNNNLIQNIISEDARAFGQCLANNTFSTKLKNYSEEQILTSKSYLGDLFRFGIYGIYLNNLVKEDGMEILMLISKVKISLVNKYWKIIILKNRFYASIYKLVRR